MIYETVGLALGSSIALGVSSEVGVSVDMGHWTLDAGARFTAGACLGSDDQFSFDAIKDASFALTIAPYLGVGVAF